MSHPSTSRRNAFLVLGLGAALAAVLLFAGLGSFGMWEPYETDRADVADSLLRHAPLPDHARPGLHLEERIIAAVWSMAGRSELAGRVPLALTALGAVIALFLLFRPLVGTRTAGFAMLALGTAPLVLFNGRQITGAAPMLLGEVLAVGGLALAAYATTRGGKVAGWISGGAGLVVGCLAGGALVGVAAPCAAVALALGFAGEMTPIRRAEGIEPPRQRQLVGLVAGLVAVLAAAAFAATVLLAGKDVPLATGGLAAIPPKRKSFDFVLEQLAYGWYPWSALAPAAILGLLVSSEEVFGRERFARWLVVSGLACLYAAAQVLAWNRGMGFCFAAVPVALAAAIAISDMERASDPPRLAALMALVLAAMIIRDLAQRPEALLSGYGFDGLTLPKGAFKPTLEVTIFSAPFFALVLALGLFGTDPLKPSRLLALRAPVLLSLAAASFGGYLVFRAVPELSVHLSSKYALSAYERFRKSGEPLGVFGTGRFLAGATKLDSQRDFIAWLSRPERVFALFSPKDLASLDRKVRERTKEHIFVLDAASDRFMLATSKSKDGEVNRNPIAPFVRFAPFADKPEHPLDVDFDGKLAFLGWSLRSPGGKDVFERGKDFTLTTYWRCDAPLSGDYQIFMHIDGPGGRLHGDHDPLQDIYPTSKWSKGDYIKDVFKKQVPLYQTAGRYHVAFGMFKGGGRLKILGQPNIKENALQLGAFDLR